MRSAYARSMLASAGVTDPALEHAFATIPREDFLEPPPWRYIDPNRGAPGVADRGDLTPLYADVLVALDAAQGLNNGSPALHALMLHRLAVMQGDRVLHVGAGGGYYTAMLAALAGASGHVTAVESDPPLARAAREHLRPWPNVEVIEADGAAWPHDDVHRIYVNCACADIPERWLDRLAEGGRLELPLGGPSPSAEGGERRSSARAILLLVSRTATGYAAAPVVPCAFVCADGALGGTRSQQDALYNAFDRSPVERVRSLMRRPPASPSYWLRTDRWALSTDVTPAATR